MPGLAQYQGHVNPPYGGCQGLTWRGQWCYAHSVTPNELSHVARLSRDLGVSLVVGRIPDGVASWGAYDHGTRTAYVGKSRRAYIVALHELGHAATGTDERRAWAWATAHSAREWTTDEHSFASLCLASYGLTK